MHHPEIVVFDGRQLMNAARPFAPEAYQFVLPDREGVLPWEPDYDESLRPLQRALYGPPAAEASA